MYEEEFCNRLTKLRYEKGVSARDMSLSLGLSESYINRVESQKMLPSMTVFFYICEYFNITPAEFFCTDEMDLDSIKVFHALQNLDASKREHLLAIIQDMQNP